MAHSFTFIFGIWVIGSFFSSFYFWGKRVDRSHPPIVRRFIAAAYSLSWPYFVVRAIRERQQTRTPAPTRRASGGSVTPNRTTSSGGGLHDPFATD